MKADAQFLNQPKEFWANVRTISQEVGYTKRGNKRSKTQPSIKIPSLTNVRHQFEKLGLSTAHIADQDGRLTEFGSCLFAYFEFRATVLNNTVQQQLMNKASADA